MFIVSIFHGIAMIIKMVKGGEKKCYKLIMDKQALREWRKSQGLTHKKLAGMLGVTPMALWAVHVSRYRNSKLLAKTEASKKLQKISDMI
jgi:DNA-binding XRE family transcriptional regulator